MDICLLYVYVVKFRKYKENCRKISINDLYQIQQNYPVIFNFGLFLNVLKGNDISSTPGDGEFSQLSFGIFESRLRYVYFKLSHFQ